MYTLILYKSDGCNTCRQCTMEQWGSDFSIETNVTEDTAISRIAAAFLGKPDAYGRYQAHLICVKEGIQIVHTFDVGTEWKHGIDYDAYARTDSRRDNWEEDEDDGRRLMELIRAHAETLLAERKNTKKE